MITTPEFAAVLGETYEAVRNAYGRPARIPRHPNTEWERGRRKFGVLDVYAWLVTRELCAMGFNWEESAEIVRETHPAETLVSGKGITDASFLAFWSCDDGKVSAWIGDLDSISGMIAFDQEKYSVVAVRMFPVAKILTTAREKAAAAGYVFQGKDIVPMADKGGE